MRPQDFTQRCILI
uniref:Uncharacterized protein n=1 Tax=Anguilla anguilla TaxID=7936 RepID=A0A0E9UAJ5_ANGAN